MREKEIGKERRIEKERDGRIGKEIGKPGITTSITTTITIITTAIMISPYLMI